MWPGAPASWASGPGPCACWRPGAFAASRSSWPTSGLATAGWRGGNAMSTDDGLRDAVRRFFARRPDPLELDDMTAARLLSGRLDPADAPPAYATVAHVTTAAAAPGRPD